MGLMVILSSTIVMSITIAIGTFIEVRLGTTTKVKEIFLFIIVNLAVPSVILKGFFNTNITESTLIIFGQVFSVAIGIILIGLTVGYMAGRFFRYSIEKSKQIAFLSGLGNTGFIGLPLINNVYGPEGSLYGSIFDIASTLILFSIGIVLLKKNSTLFENAKLILNAPVFSVLLGIIVSTISFDIPSIVLNLVESFSNLAGPLAMLYIGFLIPKAVRVIKGNNYGKILLLPLTIKLLILPLTTILATSFLNLNLEEKQIIIIQAGMPTVLLASVLLDKYANEENLGTLIVIYSTLLSLITIPVIILINNLFF